jgi:predicted metal-dependent hydrolase
MTSNDAKKYNVKFGRERIKIYLSIKERKTLKICVHPNKTVTVLAPKGEKVKTILKKIKERAPWIIRQRDYFERFQPLITQRQYISGESYYYLGRQYRLKVHKNSERSVKLIGKYINVYTPDAHNYSETKNSLQNWYKRHALSIYSSRAEHFRKTTERLSVKFPEIKIRHMKKRWGSCSKNNSITLNTELIKAPIHCIDYVIMHEICHLKNGSHDNGFYKLLKKYMPDWEIRKERLERVII